MRLIDADALKEILRYKLIEFVKHPTFVRSDMEEGIDRGISCALLAIDDAPTIQSDEPRVMTLEEAKKAEVCWLEQCGYEPFATLEASTWNPERYGKSYRCWNHMPTEEQRKAVKWGG